MSNYQSFANYKLITTFGCLLVAVALIFFFLWPLFQEFELARQNLANKRIELENKENYLNKLNQLSRQLEDYQEELNIILAALPSSPSLPSLFNHLQQLASEAGLILEDIGSFATVPSESMANLQKTSFSVTLSGTYSAFKTFLLSAEKSSRLITVESISFSRVGDEEEAGESFSFKLNMNVYSE